jgi:uncharacterized protein YycO
MFKKLLLASLLAAFGAAASAANYFLVVPVKGKSEVVGAIQVALNSGSLPGAQVGAAYSYNFSQHLQVTGDPAYSGFGVSWTVAQGSLPAGLVLDSKSGVLSGVPTAGGPSSFTLKATYKTKAGQNSYQLGVVSIDVALAGATPPAGQVGLAYSYNFSQNLQVTGDAAYTGANVVWSVSQGTLPAGLALNSASGVLSGVPTAGGASTFTVKATYKTKAGERSYQVGVVNIQVALGAGTPPSGTVGQAYSYDLRPLLSVQGDGNYDATKVQWVVGGTLPAGLAFSGGVVSGTPTTPSKPTVDVTATYKSIAATRGFTFDVRAPTGLALVSGHRNWADGTYAASCNAYRTPTDGHVYSGSTGDGTYRINLGGTPVDVYCDMTSDGGGWTLVRRLAASSTAWHPVNDNAAGTAPAYGTYVASPQAASTFSLSYSTIPYSDLKFATGDGAKWVIVAKTVMATSTGSCGVKVNVKASHVSAVPYTVAFCLRYAAATPEDPWVSVYDHGYGGTTSTADNDTASMLYGENTTALWSTWRTTRGGANVFIR